jgi:hypothetical protein
MPHKFNADRRDKIAKQKFRVTNWPVYNESLRQRGDLTGWVSDRPFLYGRRQGGHRGAASRNIAVIYGPTSTRTTLARRSPSTCLMRQTTGRLPVRRHSLQCRVRRLAADGNRISLNKKAVATRLLLSETNYCGHFVISPDLSARLLFEFEINNDR